MAGNFICRRQYLDIKSLNKEISPTSTLRHHHMITFNFNFEIVFRNWRLDDLTTPLVFLRQVERDSIQASTTVTMTRDGPDRDARVLLALVLAPIPLKIALRRCLIEEALKEAREIVGSNESCVGANLEFNLILLHERIYVGRGIAGGICTGMVPTAESSIRSLKTVACGSVAGESRSICLEEFSGREGDLSGRDRAELLGMPCEHVFHGDCIRKWLRSSNYCLLCRYEMPIHYID